MIRRSARKVTQFYEGALREAGIKPTQFTIVATLANTGAIPLSQLADQLEKIADTRSERAHLVARIDEEIETKDTEITRLNSQAEELSALVAALARVVPAMPDVDAEPFAGQTAQLSWPANGPVLKRPPMGLKTAPLERVS